MKIDIFNHILTERFFAEFLKVAPGLKDMGKRSRNIPVMVDLEARFRLGEPEQVERGLREDDVDALARGDVEHGIGEAGVGAGRDDVECVRQHAPDRALGHVRADEAHLALAVLAQRA